MTILPTPRQLHYFATVAAEGHFGRAAERLGLAQPALTQQIQRLEALIGFRLFERRPRVELTAAGELLLARAERTLADLEGAIETARRTARGETGRLTIGAVASALLVRPITAAVRRFALEQGGVTLEITAMDTADQLEALTRRRIDLAILRDPLVDPALLRVERLFRERLIVALPSGHPLQGRAGVRLAQLAGESFLLFPRSSNPGLHDRITALCRSAGFSPRVTSETGDVQARLGLVAAGVGVTITAASLRRTHPALTFRTLREAEAWTSVIVGSYAGRPLPPAAVSFCHSFGQPTGEALSSTLS
jgi:DNA-binding transcriptional LysR family regulator